MAMHLGWKQEHVLLGGHREDQEVDKIEDWKQNLTEVEGHHCLSEWSKMKRAIRRGIQRSFFKVFKGQFFHIPRFFYFTYPYVTLSLHRNPLFTAVLQYWVWQEVKHCLEIRKQKVKPQTHIAYLYQLAFLQWQGRLQMLWARSRDNEDCTPVQSIIVFLHTWCPVGVCLATSGSA